MRKTCADIVFDAVVVGAGQKFPCLIVETLQSGLDESARWRAAKTIVERIAAHPAHLFPHERIEDPRRVIVIDQGRLVRTQVCITHLLVPRRAAADSDTCRTRGTFGTCHSYSPGCSLLNLSQSSGDRGIIP